MTNEEYEIHLKKMIRNYEERYIWYKKLISEIYKDKITYPDVDNDLINNDLLSSPIKLTDKSGNIFIGDDAKAELADKINYWKNVNWYKQFLREEKNENEKELKHLQEELYNFRQGLNPPFCYKTTQFGVEFVNFK